MEKLKGHDSHLTHDQAREVVLDLYDQMIRDLNDELLPEERKTIVTCDECREEVKRVINDEIPPPLKEAEGRFGVDSMRGILCTQIDVEGNGFKEGRALVPERYLRSRELMYMLCAETEAEMSSVYMDNLFQIMEILGSRSLSPELQKEAMKIQESTQKKAMIVSFLQTLKDPKTRVIGDQEYFDDLIQKLENNEVENPEDAELRYRALLVASFIANRFELSPDDGLIVLEEVVEELRERKKRSN